MQQANGSHTVSTCSIKALSVSLPNSHNPCQGLQTSVVPSRLFHALNSYPLSPAHYHGSSAALQHLSMFLTMASLPYTNPSPFAKHVFSQHIFCFHYIMYPAPYCSNSATSCSLPCQVTCLVTFIFGGARIKQRLFHSSPIKPDFQTISKQPNLFSTPVRTYFSMILPPSSLLQSSLAFSKKMRMTYCTASHHQSV